MRLRTTTTSGQLNDPMTGGPLYCRIRAFDGYSQTELDSDAARQD
jgi:hypothetical protein